MREWQKININDIGRIWEIEEIFEVWAPQFPNGRIRVAVIYRKNSYFALANATILDKETGIPEGTVGWGKSVTAALEDMIVNFLEEMRIHGNEMENDFEFSEPEDF
jgi:hypothetical protein